MRAFNLAARAEAEVGLRRIVKGIAASSRADCEVTYTRQYPILLNDAAADIALQVGKTIFSAVDANPPQIMAVEDFAFMLEDRPGWLSGWPERPGLKTC